MNNIAVVFPGQGSQYVGMGSDLFKKDIFQHRMSQVANVLEISPEELFQLNTSDTNIIQPYIYGMSVAVFELWQAQYDVQPSVFAGHSLGEFSALVASGSVKFEDGLEIVKKRSELMKNVPSGISYKEDKNHYDMDFVPNYYRKCKFDRVLSNSFAFGGNNASVKLRR